MTNIGRKFCGLINNTDNLKLQLHLLSPANEVCEGSVFTGVCLSVGSMCGRGACVVGEGMHGRGGGIHGRGEAYMAGEHVWRGVCMVGGMHDGGHAWWGWGCGRSICGMGASVTGGMCGRGGACVAGETVCSEWYASYWNAFLL